MFANFLIGLREGLEAALIVGILVAYLRSSERRRDIPAVWAGVGTAVGAALGFGALLTFGPHGLAEKTQEGIQGSLSVLAVGFIAWMIFWTQRFSKGLRSDLQGRVDAVSNGSTFGLALVAFLAVGREGIETALFLWAAAKATASSWSPLLGSALGLSVAVLIGVAIFRGSIKINMHKFFTYTGIGLIVIAAGVFADGVNALQNAGILPGVSQLAFDVSAQIHPASTLATLLGATVEFTPTPTVLQLIAWFVFIIPVAAIYLRNARAK